MSADKYEVVIGLEVHVQLATQSKIFSWSSAAFGADPNTHTDPVCLGLPGTLPVLNARRRRVGGAPRAGGGLQDPPALPVLAQALLLSRPAQGLSNLAVRRADLRGRRDHLPPARRAPIACASCASTWKRTRARTCTPPRASASSTTTARASRCARSSASPTSARRKRPSEYVRAVRALVRYLGICDGNMEEGSLRCDANVSLRLRGAKEYGTKTELKNMNSFKNVRDAIESEVKRQAALLDRGERVVQETRLWDAARGMSAAMRSKEQAHDYRYFPEPDLPPLVVTDGELEKARASLPELPEDRFARYTTSSGLSPQDAGVLVAEKEVAGYFDATVAAGAPPKRAANWVINEVLARVDDPRKLGAADVAIAPAALAELIGLIESGKISGKLGKDIFARMWTERRRAGEIVAAEGLAQVSDSGAIEEACRKVVAANPDEVGRYRAGNAKLMGFFVGAVMKETGGKANPKSRQRDPATTASNLRSRDGGPSSASGTAAPEPPRSAVADLLARRPRRDDRSAAAARRGDLERLRHLGRRGARDRRPRGARRAGDRLCGRRSRSRWRSAARRRRRRCASTCARSARRGRLRSTWARRSIAWRTPIASGRDAVAEAQAIWDRGSGGVPRDRRARRGARCPTRATVLTHCNAGALATAGYGTALGVIRAAVAAGKRLRVLCDETRPFLQGARLTAWELDAGRHPGRGDRRRRRAALPRAAARSWPRWSAPTASRATATSPTRSARSGLRPPRRCSTCRSTWPRRTPRSTPTPRPARGSRSSRGRRRRSRTSASAASCRPRPG